MGERRYKRKGFWVIWLGWKIGEVLVGFKVFSFLTHQNVLSHIGRENLDDFTTTELGTFCPYIYCNVKDASLFDFFFSCIFSFCLTFSFFVGLFFSCSLSLMYTLATAI